ncbi:hypothetical protein [Micromonospora chersina]
MSSPDGISGGYDTARLSAAEQDRLAREERQADALRYLERHGEADGEDSIAAMLGLIEVPGRKFRRVNGHRVAS